MRGLRGATPLVVSAFGWIAVAAAAPSAKVSLTYERAPEASGCAGEASLRAAVIARLGHDPFDASGSRTITARMSRVGVAWKGRITTTSAENAEPRVRTLDSKSASCDELFDAVALAIALAIDPVSATSPPSVSVVAPPASSSVSSPSVSATSSSSSSVSPAPSAYVAPAASATAAPSALSRPAPASSGTSSITETRLVGGGGARGAVGISPRPTIVPFLSIGIAHARLSIDLEVSAEIPTTAQLGARRARTWVLAGAIVPCVHFRGPFACGGVALGLRSASGAGVDDPRDASLLHAAGELRVGWEIVFGPHRLRMHADASFPLVRPSLDVGGQTVWTAPSIGGALGLGFVTVLR